MSTMRVTAENFLDACDTGKGWDACRQYCQNGATFAAQAAALSGVTTLEAYTEWARGLLTPMPDCGYETRALAVDEDRNRAVVAAVFRGTHTGPGGPVAPAGGKVETDYVYVMEFEGGKIRHITKVWNDGFALTQLGWV